MAHEDYFRNYEYMYRSAGWRQFIDEIESVQSGFNYDGVADFESFLRVQSARNQLNLILNFEMSIQHIKDSQEESSDDPV